MMSYIIVALASGLTLGYFIGRLTAHDNADEGEVVGWEDQS